MKRLVGIIFLFSGLIFSKINDREIANMFMLGFYGTSNSDSSIKNDICKRGLGGVILFSKSPIIKGAIKNFSDAKSLKALTNHLKSCGTKPLIAVDQEGGVVQRIKFHKYPKASEVAKMGVQKAKAIYNQMAYELSILGVNLNLAPVADLAINPKNSVIVKWGRSFGANAKSVIQYDSLFIKAMHQYRIATSLKHFPGHGSSFGDTHKGFVDVTNLWKNDELKPYQALKNITDTVMVAHIFNRRIDANYPASLSSRTINGLLRGQIGFKGVVISDDMQMGAIAKHYSLGQRVQLAINAGNDIILFANQVHPKKVITIDRLIKIVRQLLRSGAIQEQTIKNANYRINLLKAGLN